MASDRFASVNVEEIIQSERNKNTEKKTKLDVQLFRDFLASKFVLLVEDFRDVQHLSEKELNLYVSEFLVSVRKQDGTDYEPSSLRSLLSSLERYLKSHDYPSSLVNSAAFRGVRDALQSKQKALKRDGKGSLPNAARPLSETEINKLCTSGQLGVSSPEGLLNAVWWNNTLHFGLRGQKEHHDMKFGDVKLKKDDIGREFLEYRERQTKTRQGDNPRNTRKTNPKAWSNDGKFDCLNPITVYKRYVAALPDGVTDDSPFYLSIRTNRQMTDKVWFKMQPIGMNKLAGLMKTMMDKAGLTRENDRKVTNHSARKTCIHQLKKNKVPDSDIVQLTGHKNLQSIINYDELSPARQNKMSVILAGEKPSTSTSSTTSQNRTCESTEPVCKPTVHNVHQSAMFPGNFVFNDQCSISFNMYPESQKSKQAKKRKLSRVIYDTDSE